MKFISIALPLTFVFAALVSAESFGVPAGTDLKDWKVPTIDLNRFNSDDFLLGYKGRDVQDDENSFERRVIVNGKTGDRKPGFAAKALTNFIYKVTGWKRPSKRSEEEELPNFKRDDFSEDALIARDEIDDDTLIARMVEIVDSRSYEEMTPIERRAIINGVDRTDKKPSFASKLLTKLIYRLAGKKN